MNPEGVRKIREIKLKDWQENSLVQIADMYSGAVYRMVTEGDDRFYKLIKKQEQDFWNFR